MTARVRFAAATMRVVVVAVLAPLATGCCGESTVVIRPIPDGAAPDGFTGRPQDLGLSIDDCHRLCDPSATQCQWVSLCADPSCDGGTSIAVACGYPYCPP